MNVLMIYPKFPAEPFWNCARSLARFTGYHVNMPPLGLLTLASYLPADFQVRLIDRNRAEETDADWEWADVIFLSLMMVQRDDYEVCLARARARGKPIAVGGRSRTRCRRSPPPTRTGSVSVKQRASSTPWSMTCEPACAANSTRAATALT